MEINRGKIRLKDFFGTTKDYYLYGVQTDFSILQLASNLSKLFSSPFYSLGEISFENNPDLEFLLFFSQICENEDIYLTLIENKTYHFDYFNVYKTEKNLPFNTLPLFQDAYYIFNKLGLKFYAWEYLNIDYLILIYTEKKREVDYVFDALHSLTKVKLFDATNMLQPNATRVSPKTIFLQRLFCKIEIENSNFLEEQKKNILTGRKKIPAQNLTNCLNSELSVTFNREYLDYLSKDCVE